jgi:hypothetical protein
VKLLADEREIGQLDQCGLEQLTHLLALMGLAKGGKVGCV